MLRVLLQWLLSEIALRLGMQRYQQKIPLLLMMKQLEIYKGISCFIPSFCPLFRCAVPVQIADLLFGYYS